MRITGGELAKLVHTVLLLPARIVKPFVSGKNIDKNDALSIAEAARRPGLHAIPVKSEQQQDLQDLHKWRLSLINMRTQLTNMLRSLLSVSDEVLKHLMQIPSMVPVVSSAFLSTLGDGR